MGHGYHARHRGHRFRSPVAVALVVLLAGTASSAALNRSTEKATEVSSGTPTGSGTLGAEAHRPASVTRVTRTGGVRLVHSVAAGHGGSGLQPAVHVVSTAGTGAENPRVTSVLLAAYRSAVAASPASCHLPVSLLAAIGQVESGSLVGRTLDARHRTSVLGPVLDGHGGFAAVPDTDHGRWDGNTKWDRAVGAMQLLPSTVRTFGVDGDGDGVVDPQDVYDATATAAAYLCYGGRNLADPAVLSSAVLAYNHSTAYRDLVLTYQRRYAAAGLDRAMPASGSVPTLAVRLPASAVTAATHSRADSHLALGSLKHTAAGAGRVHPARTSRPSGSPTGTHAGTRTHTGSTGSSRPADSTHHGSHQTASPSPTATSTETGGVPTVGPTPTHDPSDTPSPSPVCPTTPAAGATDSASSTATATPTGQPTGSADPSGTPTCPPCAMPTATATASATPTGSPTTCAADPSGDVSTTASPTPTP